MYYCFTTIYIYTWREVRIRWIFNRISKFIKIVRIITNIHNFHSVLLQIDFDDKRHRDMFKIGGSSQNIFYDLPVVFEILLQPSKILEHYLIENLRA